LGVSQSGMWVRTACCQVPSGLWFPQCAEESQTGYETQAPLSTELSHMKLNYNGWPQLPTTYQMVESCGLQLPRNRDIRL